LSFTNVKHLHDLLNRQFISLTRMNHFYSCVFVAMMTTARLR